MSSKPAKKTGVSIFKELNAVGASDVPFEFEYEGPGGVLTGVFFRVLGDHSERVSTAVNASVNKRRKDDAVRMAKAAKARPDSVDPGKVEDDIAFSRRLAAVRLVGWRCAGETEGLDADQLERFRPVDEPYTEENALALCQVNPDVAKQVLERAGELGNFMQVSPQDS